MKWNDIRTAPVNERVLVRNEMWDGTFGEVQIAQREGAQWVFDTGMLLDDLDEFDQSEGITAEDYQPQGWLPLPGTDRAER